MKPQFGPQTDEGTYAEILAERRKAYDEHIAGMEISDEIKQWSDWMTERFGPKCDVGLSTFGPNRVDWITALLIVRYGESITTNTTTKEKKHVQFWPSEFSKDDLKRAVEWTQGQKPPQVKYVEAASIVEGVRKAERN